MDILELSAEDFFHLLDVLGKDPAIRSHNNFNPLIAYFISEQDCYKIIAGSNVQASLWLVQVLCALAQWLQAQDLTAAELKQWLTGADRNAAEAANRRQQKIDFLNGLYTQFQPVMFDAILFESETVDSRTARMIHQTLTETNSSLVSSQDNRLVTYDPLLAEKAAYRALTQLSNISPADFTAIGLESKMLDKIFNTLILQEYITTEGQLIEENFPASVEQFQLETDFSPQREDLFTIIHDLLMEVIAVDEEESIDHQSSNQAEDEGEDDTEDELENEFEDELEDETGSDLEVVIRFNALLSGGCSRG
jgi:hypothetical protein